MNTEQGGDPPQPPQEGSFLDRRASRRGFISGFVKGGLGAAALGAGIAGKADYSGESRLLPSDTLSPEQLRANRIRIHNSPQTELYLRQEVFDFDLFRDAKEGKIDEAVITLVDDDSLSWNALERIDDEFLRTLAMSTEEDPITYVEQNYDKIREDEQEKLERWQKTYQSALSDMKLLNDGELIGAIEEDIRKMEETGFRSIDNPFAKRFVDGMLEEKKERIKRIEEGTERDILAKRIEDSLAVIDKSQELLDNTQTIDAAKEYFAGRSLTYGRIVRAKKGIDFSNRERFSERQEEIGSRLDELDPNWKNKVFIYIAVGGRLTPTPEDSYPDPEWFDKHEQSFHPDVYVVDMETSRAAGLHVLRHEVAHYDEGKLVEEGITDRKALDSLAKASERYKTEGDDGGYAFVFKNKHGITYAKNQQNQERVENI